MSAMIWQIARVVQLKKVAHNVNSWKLPRKPEIGGKNIQIPKIGRKTVCKIYFEMGFNQARGRVFTR